MSLLPLSPPTVENRATRGAWEPFFAICTKEEQGQESQCTVSLLSCFDQELTLAQHKSVKSSVVSQVPKAPAPLAWTTRSGIRSRSKALRVSLKEEDHRGEGTESRDRTTGREDRRMSTSR